MESICSYKSNVAKMLISLFHAEENIVGKGEKDLYCRHVKHQGLFGRGLKISIIVLLSSIHFSRIFLL